MSLRSLKSLHGLFLFFKLQHFRGTFLLCFWSYFITLWNRHQWILFQQYFLNAQTLLLGDFVTAASVTGKYFVSNYFNLFVSWWLSVVARKLWICSCCPSSVAFRSWHHASQGPKPQSPQREAPQRPELASSAHWWQNMSGVVTHLHSEHIRRIFCIRNGSSCSGFCSFRVCFSLLLLMSDLRIIKL